MDIFNEKNAIKTYLVSLMYTWLGQDSFQNILVSEYCLIVFLDLFEIRIVDVSANVPVY